MNRVYFVTGAAATFGLVGVLVRALRGGRKREGNEQLLTALENAPRHLLNMPQIRQAMEAADLEFAGAEVGPALLSRMRRERRQVVLLYLAAIRRDFEQSLRIARIIAVLSPEVSGSREYQRLRLSIVFHIRYQVAKVGLLMGSVKMPQVTLLGQMATSLAVQMEETMAKLGERAALAAELTLQTDR